MSQLKIPKGKEDITREWIIAATSSHLIPIEGSISVEEILSAGVMSNLLRIKFQTKRGTTESILLKLLPTNPFFLALNTDGGCDKREIKIYSEVIPQISQVLPNLSNNFCTFYNGFSNGELKTGDYSSILVLEDLELAGYKNMDAESPNWMENLRKGLKFLGELHSFGVYLEAKHKKRIPEIYHFIHMPSEELTQMAIKWSGTFPPKLDELLKKYEREEIRWAYQKLNEQLEQVITKSFGKAMDNPVLAHGDPWTSNILVNDDLDKPLKVIDFQFFGYRNPAWEHVKFILSALPKDQLNRENVTKALHLYLKYFKESCQSLGVKYEGNENDFFKFFNTWGMAFGYCWWLLGIGSFKDDEERLVKIFEMMEKEYKIADFLLNEF